MNMNLKEGFNSDASIKTYAGKNMLFDIEERIFETLKFKKDIKILDLWCGAGRTTFALLEKGFTDITAIDFSDRLIEVAQKKDSRTWNIFSVWDASNLGFDDEKFDLVFFSYNGIDYLPNRELRLKAFSETQRVLKKGGSFLFSSHNRLCLPVNRNLLFTQIKNFYRIFSEYWYTKQSFWNIKTYYSNPYRLEKELIQFWFQKEKVFCNSDFFYPFLKTFPYYLYKKN